jgi:hypothetical protein
MVLSEFSTIQMILETHPLYKKYFDNLPYVGVPGVAIRNEMRRDNVPAQIIQLIPGDSLIKRKQDASRLKAKNEVDLVFTERKEVLHQPERKVASNSVKDIAAKFANLKVIEKPVLATPKASVNNIPIFSPAPTTSTHSIQRQAFTSMRNKLEGLASER